MAETATVQTPTPTPTPWYQGADAELTGHIQTLGLHEKPANEAALSAAKSHRELQKRLGEITGIPHDQLVRWPKDAADETNWKAIRAKLGVPTDPKEYDFAGLKLGGEDIEENFTDALRTMATSLHLPKDAAKGVAEGVIKYLESAETEEKAVKTASVAAEKTKLAASWGVNFDANMLVARQAAAKLGVKPEVVQTLEGVIGYADVMELFRSVGARTGEDTYVRGDRPDGNVMTREQAKSTLEDRKRDKAWGERLMKGDAVTVREFNALTTLISPSGDDTLESHRRASGRGR